VINDGIAGKRGLLLTPAIYNLEAPIAIRRDGFVLLGIGFPTLLATEGQAALTIDAPHARVAGILLEPATDVTTTITAPLMRWSADDGVGSDVFTRVGAFNYSTPAKPSCRETRAHTHLLVEGRNVILDNTWLWHADHDDCGGASDQSYSAHALEVTGDDVLVYGLKAEHTMETIVMWRGEGGAVFMFQSELPYHMPGFAGVGYKVADTVARHTAVGVGVYIIGTLEMATGIELPAAAEATNLFSWVIGRNHSQFQSVVCTGEGGARVCYQGNTCDFSSCYQLALPHAPARASARL